MSVTVGNLQVNKFEKVSSLVPPPAVELRLGPGGGSLHGEVQCVMGNGHTGPPPFDRQIDRHD